MYPDVAYRLNMSMDERDGKRWSPDVFREITGTTVDELWDEYRATL